MKSNIKEFSEDKIYEDNKNNILKENKIKNEEKDDESNTMKIDSILMKANTEKLDDNININANNEDYSSFDENFYSDASSGDEGGEEGISGIKKTKTLNYKNDNYDYEKFNILKRRSNYIETKLMTSITKKENANRKNLELAKSINFKSLPDKIIETDEFGFLKNVERPGESPYTTRKG